MLPASRFMTVKEVAAYMRVSDMTVYRLIESGQLRATRAGRSWRIQTSDAEAYLDASYNRPAPVAGA